MTFEKAIWYFEKISIQHLQDGDLDIELVINCMKTFENSPDQMTPDLARTLHEQLRMLEKVFDQQKNSYKQRLHKIREGRHALYKYRDKNLKVNNRFLYKNV